MKLQKWKYMVEWNDNINLIFENGIQERDRNNKEIQRRNENGLKNSITHLENTGGSLSRKMDQEDPLSVLLDIHKSWTYLKTTWT